MKRLGRWFEVATALLLCGCGGGGGGGDSAGQKLVSGRDLSDPFFWSGETLAYVRATADPSQPEPQDLWIHDLPANLSSLALPGIDWAPPTSWPRARAGELLITGSTGQRFFDFASRVDADLTDFGLAPSDNPAYRLFTDVAHSGQAARFPITVIRRDAGAVALAGGNSGALGVGWPSSLRTLILPGSIGEVSFLGTDVAILYAPYVEGAEQKAGIYRVSLPQGDLTPLIPPRPIADWDGIAGSCSVGSGCLFRVVGCDASDPVCPGTGKAPCTILYGTKSTDGFAVVPHAYDVATGTDVELPGLVTRFTVSGDQHRVIWDDRNAIKVNYWDLCTGARLECPNIPVGPVIWRPDGNGFAAVDPANYNFGVASLVDGTCVGQSFPVAVFGVQYAPASDRLLWLGNSAVGSNVTRAWLAAADGSDAVSIADGDIFGVGYAGDGRRIFIGRAGTSNAALSWLDPDVSPPVEHLLADNYGGFSAVGSQRVLLIDHWNSQDGNGELTLIDMETDSRQRIARAVTDMTTAGSVDGAGTNVAYMVRTRVSSDRDGLWLTTLP